VISPVQRKESISYSRHKTQTSDIMTIESPKPLKEYKVADTRSLMSRSIKHLIKQKLKFNFNFQLYFTFKRFFKAYCEYK